MKSENTAIYPGTFDPVHFGHLDVVAAASQIFPKVIWAIGVNSAKKPMFTIGQRMEMMRLCLADRFLNVSVMTFGGLLVNFTKTLKAGSVIIVRSLRMSMDFELEFQMTLMNRKLERNLTTIYIPAKQENMHLSSTAIRELFLNGEPLGQHVPQSVCEYIRKVKF